VSLNVDPKSNFATHDFSLLLLLLLLLLVAAAARERGGGGGRAGEKLERRR